MLVATATGELVFFHDDDSRFSTPDDLATSVDYPMSHPKVAAVALKAGLPGDCNPQFDGSAPFASYHYIACAVLFRRSVFK